jgi:hypothetical protein
MKLVLCRYSKILQSRRKILSSCLTLSLSALSCTSQPQSCLHPHPNFPSHTCLKAASNCSSFPRFLRLPSLSDLQLRRPVCLLPQPCSICVKFSVSASISFNLLPSLPNHLFPPSCALPTLLLACCFSRIRTLFAKILQPALALLAICLPLPA